MTPPPFVATLHFEAFLRVPCSSVAPQDESFPIDLGIEWSIRIGYPHKVYYFPQNILFRTETLLAALTPRSEQQLLLDYSNEDPTENVYVSIVDHDTRTIAWHHNRLRGIVRSGCEPNLTQSWELLPNPVYFRKLHNRHFPAQFAHAVSQLVRAFPGRVRGAYTVEMQQAISSFIGEQMPSPGPYN